MSGAAAVAKVEPLIKPGIYRHYEGASEYKVIAIATDAETGEEVLIYQELFGMHLWKVERVGDAAEKFFYKVKDKNYHGPRYKLIREF